jgi:hypothetical protein
LVGVKLDLPWGFLSVLFKLKNVLFFIEIELGVNILNASGVLNLTFLSFFNLFLDKLINELFF